MTHQAWRDVAVLACSVSLLLGLCLGLLIWSGQLTSGTSPPTPQPGDQPASATSSPTDASTHRRATTVYARCPEELCQLGPSKVGTLGYFHGVGYVTLTYSRAPGPDRNAAVFTSVFCDGDSSVYGGAFNLESGMTTQKIVPFAGNRCRIGIAPRADERWRGNEIAIRVEAGDPVVLEGKPYHATAEWVTKPISDSRVLSFGDQSKFEGFLTLKLTACSTRGGATDATASDACKGHVLSRTDSEVVIRIEDDKGLLVSQNAHVAWRTHHDTFTVELPRRVEGTLRVKVAKLAGSDMLVHGPGSGLVGIRG